MALNVGEVDYSGAFHLVIKELGLQILETSIGISIGVWSLEGAILVNDTEHIQDEFVVINAPMQEDLGDLTCTWKAVGGKS